MTRAGDEDPDYAERVIKEASSSSGVSLLFRRERVCWIPATVATDPDGWVPENYRIQPLARAVA
jgi:hypothetical protein